MRVYRYRNEPEAQKIKLLLAEQKIPCELHSFENWGYDGVFRGQIGMGEVVVPEEFADKAKHIINEFLKKEPSYKEDKELRIMKLETMVKSHKTGKFIYPIFIIFGILFALVLKGVVGVIGSGIIIAIFIAIFFFELNKIKNVRKELSKLKKIASRNKVEK